MDDILIFTGDAVKALGDGRVGGYLARFTKSGDYDLTGDRFDAATDFGDADKLPVLFNHGMDRTLGRKRIGKSELRRDDVGLWVEAQLQQRDEYERAIYELAEQGKLSWSSGAAAHTVEREQEGKGAYIKQWYLSEASLTPTPAEPRNVAVSIKSLELESAQTQNSAKATDEDAAKTASSGADAVNVQAQQNNIAEQSAEETKKMEAKFAPDVDARIAELAAELASLTANSDAPQGNGDATMSKSIEAAPQIDKVAELEKQLNELKAKFDAPAVNTGAPAIKKVTERGFADDEVKSFLHWIRTGDDKPYKAAMQGQTDSEGGYAVPDDFYNQIVAKRNEVSIARQMGVQIYPTTLDRVLVPVEDTAATKFVVTAEEGSYDENEPTLNQVAITVHKLTKLIKMSEELEADARGNFGAYIANIWGRTLGLAENYYFFNIAANGTSQPQSATYAATTTTAVASQTAFTAAELLDLIYAMPSAYSEKMVLVMRRSVLGKVRSLTGNPFSFIPTPHGAGGPNTSGGLAGYLHDVPVYVTDNLPAQAAANKPVLLLNPDFYMIAEREGLNVARNPYLYQATGQIGFFARARMGGALLQSEAAYVLVSKT